MQYQRLPEKAEDSCDAWTVLAWEGVLDLRRGFGGSCAHLSCGSPDKAGSFRLLPECERLGGAANDRMNHRRFMNTISSSL